MLQVGSSAVSSSKLLRLKMAQFRWHREHHHHHHHLHFQNGNVDFNPPSERSPPCLQSPVNHPDFRPFGEDRFLSYSLALHRSTWPLLQGGSKSCSKDAGCNLSFPTCTFTLLISPHPAEQGTPLCAPSHLMYCPVHAMPLIAAARVPPAGANFKPSFLVNFQHGLHGIILKLLFHDLWEQ